MCLVVLAWTPPGPVRLAVAANRDEFFARPAAPAAPWAEAPDVFAGRDLRGGGTWLGVTRSGRFAALTNYRDLTVPRKTGAPSRGRLVRDFLGGEEKAAGFVSRIVTGADAFEGFNLVVSDGEELWSVSNVEGDAVRLTPGVWGLSNHLLETPWPKVVTARRRLAEALATAPSPDALERSLLALLGDRAVAPDEALPHTGLPLEQERALSAAFVVLPDYGTRASTAVVVAKEEVRFAERSFGPGGAPLGEVREAFRLSGSPRA